MKKTVVEFCLDYIKNDKTLKLLGDDIIMLITFAIVASDCVKAYQKALTEGVEFEASKREE